MKKWNWNVFWSFGWWTVSGIILACGLWYLFKGFTLYGIDYWHDISLWNWLWVILDFFFFAWNTYCVIPYFKRWIYKIRKKREEGK